MGVAHGHFCATSETETAAVTVMFLGSPFLFAGSAEIRFRTGVFPIFHFIFTPGAEVRLGPAVVRAIQGPVFFAHAAKECFSADMPVAAFNGSSRTAAGWFSTYFCIITGVVFPYLPATVEARLGSPVRMVL